MLATDITRGLTIESSNQKLIDAALAEPYDLERIKSTTLALAGDMSTYDNSRAAGRLLMYNATRICGTVEDYTEFMKHRLGRETYSFITGNAEVLQKEVDARVSSDYEHHDLFSAATMVKTYLMRPTHGEEPWETPQQLYLRVAVFLHHDKGLDRVIKCYRELSDGYYTPSSPSMFNLGTDKPQGGSCFLIRISDDLKEILYTGVGDCGMISKLNGGLGIGVSDLRHSAIGHVGTSSGIMPPLRIYDKSIKYVDQGGKRDGAGTAILRDWHIDCKEFIESKDNFKDHQFRLVTLNTCMWMSRMFFKRVKEGGIWTVFCPAKAAALKGLYGYEFEQKYVEMERLAIVRENEFKIASAAVDALHKVLIVDHCNRTLRKQHMAALAFKSKARKARIEHKVHQAAELYDLICDIQIKSGNPYIVHGDSVNVKSNQKNLGTIDQTNLCLEIMERNNPRNPDGIPSCNLSSMNMARFAKATVTVPVTHADFLKQLRAAYDFKLYAEKTGSVIENLEELIDKNYYPLDTHDADGKVIARGKISSLNFDMRNLGVGVSGWWDAIAIMDLAYEDPRTELWNKMVFACSYFNGMITSMRLAIERGEYYEFRTGSYKQYAGFEVKAGIKVPKYVECKGSPLSNGQFQFDMWAEEAQYLSDFDELDSKVYDRDDDKPVDPTLWGQEPITFTTTDVKGASVTVTVEPTWESLRTLIKLHGVRHSLLFALMPTASTAQTFCNAENTEAHQANLYARQVGSGSYTVVNRHLERDLITLKCWTPDFIEFLGACKGSVKYLINYIEDHPIDFRHCFEEKTRKETITELASARTTSSTNTATGIITLYDIKVGSTKASVVVDGKQYDVELKRAPTDADDMVYLVYEVEHFTMKSAIRERLEWLVKKYKTMYEISQKVSLKYTAQRGRYICQSQSTNVFIEDPTKTTMQAIHSFSSKIGNKTGMYYLRQNPALFTGNFNTKASVLRYYMALMLKLGKKPTLPKPIRLPLPVESPAASPRPLTKDEGDADFCLPGCISCS